jgi:hypothetical protein
MFHVPYHLFVRLFASGTLGFMYHLHDDPPDKDMVHEVVNNRFRYTAATSDASWQYIHTSITPHKSANEYYNLW